VGECGARADAGAQGQGRGRDRGRSHRRQVWTRNYDLIPSVIYNRAGDRLAGKTEAQAREAGIDCKIGVFPFAAAGRARAMESTAGFVKLIADRATDEILGVHIIGPLAGELIAEAVLAMEFGAVPKICSAPCTPPHALGSTARSGARRRPSARSTTSTARGRCPAAVSGGAFGAQDARYAAQPLEHLSQLRQIAHRGAHHDGGDAIGGVRVRVDPSILSAPGRRCL